MPARVQDSVLESVPAMLAEGMSHREIARTIGVSRATIHRRFPGTGWTYPQAGSFARSVRDANKALRELTRKSHDTQEKR